ncbi:MAG: glycoside hydrolase family 25 protein [Chitinophagaceae bacterium]
MAKKKSAKTPKGYKILIAIMIVSIVAMFGVAGYEWWKVRRAKFIRYPEFGIDMPVSYEIHGIDVSKYQQTINWEAVKEMEVEGIKLGFAFIKATEGLGNVDRQFRRNWKRAGDAAMPRGAYHFFLATKSGRIQAENFIKTVALEPGDLPPVLDVEQTYGVATAKIKAEVKTWLDIVEVHYGVKPILYTNVSFYEKYLGEDFDGYPLWVAHYLQKERPRIGRTWHFWQHSETGRVNGIRSLVDFNVFKGDSTDFRELLVK